MAESLPLFAGQIPVQITTSQEADIVGVERRFVHRTVSFARRVYVAVTATRRASP